MASTLQATATVAARWPLLVAIFYVNLMSLAAQVVWVRRLSLVFGSTAFVLSAVLGFFLLGLALGAAAGGRMAQRGLARREWVAALIAALGTLCLVSLGLFDLGRAAYAAIAPASAAPWVSASAKLFIVGLGILPPTLAIGAILPLVTQIDARATGAVGRSVSVVYGLDTLGAALGALLAGFVLVPRLGLATSTYVLGGGALVVALLVWRLAPASSEPARTPEASSGGERPSRAPLSRRQLAGFLAFALSGCAALWLQTGWNRFFYVLNGTSVFSLSVVLAGFLGGIGIGSLLARRRADRVRDLPRTIALLQIVIAVCGILVFRARELFERAYLSIFQSSDGEYAFFSKIFLMIFLLVLAATLAMGANFPLVTRWLASLRPAGQDGAGATLGRAYAINTLGAVVGAFSSEYLLLPVFGFGGLLVASVVLYLASATLFAMQSEAARHPRRLWKLAAAGVAAFALSPAVLPFEPPKSSVYYHGVRDRTFANYEAANDSMTSLWRRQGFYGQVEVLTAGPALFLKHNGKTDATNLPGDSYAQTLLGHLPFFFHDKAERVLNIGLGGGLTLAAINRHPEPRSIVQVEIDPLVAEAARIHFAATNRRSMEDPRVRLVLDDGRNFVERSNDTFDIIVSEPPNIWVAGVSGLFTREFYAAARQRLAPGGLLSQWFPIHELSADDFRVAMRTLTLEFPHASVWTNGYDAIVLASLEPLASTSERWARVAALAGIADDFAAFGVRRDGIVSMVERPRFRGADLLAAAPGTLINTDDRPVLEFRSAVNLYLFSKTGRRDHWMVGGR